MSKFKILLRKELKDSLFSKGKGEKRDFISVLFSLLLLAIVIIGLIYIALTISKSYLTLKFQGEINQTLRSAELLNILYSLFSVFLLIFILEKERKIIVEAKDKSILLRLPVKASTIFLTKFLVIYILALISSLSIILPLNLIYYIAISKFNYLYIIGTLVNVIAYPTLPFLIATILLIPYVKIINFFKNRQLITLIFYVLLICGGFYLYSLLLNAFRTLLETGNIRFLFNSINMGYINSFYNYNYPLKWFVNIALGLDSLVSYLGVLAVLICALIITYFISKVLFYHTLYTNTKNKDKIYKTKLIARKPFYGLLKKEFILTYRDNGNLFSYFAIALAMPLMVYASFTLFKDLIYNAIGFKMDFILGILILFVFIVLTNTYASTNISREGNAFIKSKVYPYNPKKLFLAKVVFAFIISTLASVISSIIIICFSDLTVIEIILIIICPIIFTLSQILLGTKMDLNKATLNLNSYEIEKKQEKTITKLVFTGLFFSLVLGICLLFINVLLGQKLGDSRFSLIYLITIISVVTYLIYTLLFYLHKLNQKFINLVS